MAFFFKKKKKKRCCVLGLDGVPYTLLEKLTQNGVMPFMEKLKKEGNLSRMKVTLPEISAVSWSSFMTGTNPGTHGIYGFMDLKPNSYSLTFPSYKDLKAPAIWDKLKDSGKTSVVINQPSTYPAKPINGTLISGFVAIDIKKAVYPASLIPQLQELGYKIDVDTMKGREDKDFLIRELHETLAGRSKVLDLLWKSEDWDFFELVVTGTDRLQHFLWDALEDKSNKYHQSFLDYYNKVDSFIENVHKRFLDIAGDGDDGNEFLLLSDHGFTGIEKEVNLNFWLAEQGYLSYKKNLPDSVADISEATKAFVLDPGRIYINYKGKYPSGSVEASDGESIMSEIIGKLEGLEFEGKKVIQKVFMKEEIYNGPYLEQAPDMVALSYPGFDLKGSVKKNALFDRTVLQGMHTWDNAFFWSFGKKKEDINITDIAHIILDVFKS